MLRFPVTIDAAEDGLDDLEKKAGAAKSEVNLEEELEKTVKIQDKLNSANEAFKNTTNDVTKGLQNQAQELATNENLMSGMAERGKNIAERMNTSMNAAKNMAEYFDEIASTTANLDLAEKNRITHFKRGWRIDEFRWGLIEYSHFGKRWCAWWHIK